MPKPDWTGAVSSGLSGAATGGTLGGPWGALGGGLVGAVTGLFGGKKKKKAKKRSTLDPNQQNLNNAQHQSIFGEGPLADLYNYDPEAANEVFDKTQGRPAYRAFEENMIPKITGQFRNQGLQNSSYVGTALSRAGRDVQENLDALRSQYLYKEQSDARNAKRNAVENLQNRSTFDYDVGGSRSRGGFDIGSILNGISPEMINQFKGYFGGGA